MESMKIELRHITDADTPLIVRWRNQDFVRRNFIYRELFTDEGHAQWLRKFVDKGFAVQFIILANQRPVGSIYLKDIDYNNKKAEYGVFIGEEDALHCGIGTLAGRIILDYGFHTLGLNKIYLRFLANNIAAQKSYRRIGFHMEGLFSRDMLCEGVFEDIIFMAIFASEWQNCDHPSL